MSVILKATSLSIPYFSSVVQLCLTLCNPMNCSTPGFPVDPQLLELAQTHVHPVGDATVLIYRFSLFLLKVAQLQTFLERLENIIKQNFSKNH